MEQSSNKANSNRRTRGNGHGTIFMHKQRKCWVAEIYDIHGIRRRSSFKKKVDAETWLVTQKQGVNTRGSGISAINDLIAGDLLARKGNRGEIVCGPNLVT